MRKINQVEESRIFISRNEQSVRAVSDKLVRAAKCLIADYRSAMQDQPRLARAEERAIIRFLKAKDLAGLHTLVRARAVQLRHLRHYWDWVTACDFFLDAVGAYWPYLGQDGRGRYMTWADEGASLIVAQSAGIEALEAA